MRSVYKPLLAEKVLVNMRSGQAFSGVVYRALRDLLVLKNAVLLVERGEPKPLDGEVVLDRTQVDFIQVEPGGWQ